MIVPGSNNFSGYIGATFDTVITVYPSVYSAYTWTGNWVSGTNYSSTNIVIGNDSGAYQALRANINVNPVGDLTGSWSTPLQPMNLNGYSGVFNIMATATDEYTQTPVLSTPVIVQGLQGTMAINFTATQTGAILPGPYHQYLSVTDPSGNTYYFINGSFTWVTP